MTKSEYATSGTTVAQTKNSTESDKGRISTSSGQRVRRYRVNSSNNTRNLAASTNKDYNGEVEASGYFLALKYDKIELKKAFDVFRETIINFTIK